jgi:hypothetical protein
MKILAIEKEIPGIADELFTPKIKKDEALRVWDLYQAGALRELYFRGDWPGAVLMLECTDIEEAKALLETLPLVKENLITFDVIPLIPYPGFSRLFAARS